MLGWQHRRDEKSAYCATVSEESIPTPPESLSGCRTESAPEKRILDKLCFSIVQVQASGCLCARAPPGWPMTMCESADHHG
eukprot:CAMPEP_0181402932 /NCGR_PEP_ID=MMETSP1110-20121109/3432_1 /TAXON_ID=174948 /ORGANISM="Symbiodinium sp., Strain CCMP421" /LENGTH=80 /DNA_ID=CAMNT_0023525171 /DNA_START=1370 /DNA_END=1608 /DNA_ORIENTATION=+